MTPPDLLSFTGDWSTYVESVYERYHADIISNAPTLWGIPLRVRYNPTANGKPFNFWHVVSEGPEENERLPDLERCARIGWIAWVIDCCDKKMTGIKWWLSERTTPRGRKTNLVLWAEVCSYVVIIEPRDGFALLVSAYPVTTRRALKLQAEYETFLENPTAIPYWEQQK